MNLKIASKTRFLPNFASVLALNKSNLLKSNLLQIEF